MTRMIRLVLPCFILISTYWVTPISRVQAQVEQPVSDVTLEYEFGTTLQITAKILHPADYSSFVLILQPDGQSARQLSFVPEENGRVEIIHDLTQQSLMPFGRIYYWFELVQMDGTSINTASYWFDYLDNRFTWISSETELFQISWVEGDATFGQKLQEIAREGLEEATTLLPAAPKLPIRIYVYPEVEALQQALTLTGQTWTAGHASPEMGVIVVSNTSQSRELIEMERQIPHEIMHILEYQLAGQGYASIPAWLSEGLASSVELYPDPDLQRILNEAHANGSLLSFGSLCEGFPQDAKSAQIAYAQSVSFVNFIKGRFGSQVFTKLLENASSGLTCVNSVSSTLQVSLDQLEQDWLITIFSNSQSDLSMEEFVPFLTIGGVLILAALIIILRTRHSRERKQDVR